jgi:uncharacterized protein (DUF885 family)
MGSVSAVSDATAASTSFADLCRRFVDERLADDPVQATVVGRTEHDAELPDLSAEGHRRRDAADAAWRERFLAVDPSTLTADEAIDRDLVVMSLAKRAILAEWGEWRRSPDGYLQAGLSGVQVLFLHRLRPEPELVDAAAARLAKVPDLLAAARANLASDLASPLVLHRAIRQARAAAGWARDDVPALAGDDAGRQRLAAAGAPAAAAYDEVADALEALADRASGEWAIGEERYDALLRDAEGLPYGARGLRDRGSAAYDELAADLAARSRDIRGDDDWHALLADLGRDHPATPEAMRDAYADWTERARQFCRERDLVTLPEGERCEVLPAPPFQRGVFAVAYYIRPPAFSDSLTGHFFVPYPPADATPDQVRERLAGNSFAKIPTTAVHEAYPGHHWHLSWSAATPSSDVRRILSTSYFTEGWALYAERLLSEQGFFTDPRHEAAHVNARLFRAARIVVDTSLHIGEMSYDDGVRFMQERAGLPEEVARTEVTRYCAWPTQAASYLTGAIEIERMRDAWVAEQRGPLKEFHDRVTAIGSLPLALAERAVFGASATGAAG